MNLVFLKTGVLLLLFGSAAMPLGIPPLPEDPVLARMASEDCLAYFATAGMATPNANSRNQTEQLLAEPEIQKVAVEAERLIRNLLAEKTKTHGPEAAALATDAVDLGKILLTRPMALSLSQLRIIPLVGTDIRASAVINVGDRGAKVKEALERLQAKLPPKIVQDVTIDGATYHQIALQAKGPNLTWGLKEQHLVAAIGKGELEALLKRMNGQATPQWLARLREQLPVERVSTTSMVNVKDILAVVGPLAGAQFSKVMEATGLQGIERLSGVTGLDQAGFVSRTLITLGGEPRGLLQLISQKGLSEAELALLPGDATFALAGKKDLEKVYSTILSVVEKIEPQAANGFREGLARAEQELGLKLEDDILKPLGNTWYLFDSPGEGGLVTGITLAASLKDPQRAAATNKKLVEFIEGKLGPAPEANRGPRIEKVAFAGQDIFVFSARERGFLVAPSWCLTDKHFLLALFPEAIKAFLARGQHFSPLARTPAVAAALEGKGETLGLAYLNSQRVFDLVYPLIRLGLQAGITEMQREGIPVSEGLVPSAGSIRRHLGTNLFTVKRTSEGLEFVSRGTLPGYGSLVTSPMAVGLLLPAVQKAREAANRTRSTSNLKQIGLAMHNYHDVMGTFPPAFKADKNGKPLLSWRVLILPYIEQDALFRQFHLDEPWDSEHNQKLASQMPMIYRSPASQAKPGLANYLTVRGKDTAFPVQKGIRLQDIFDGTSNTILVVEASDSKAVPWTKPDDFEFNEQNPAGGLGGFWGGGGFLAAFCDGSVRMIPGSIDTKVLKWLFIINDGNPVPNF